MNEAEKQEHLDRLLTLLRGNKALNDKVSLVKQGLQHIRTSSQKGSREETICLGLLGHCDFLENHKNMALTEATLRMVEAYLMVLKTNEADKDTLDTALEAAYSRRIHVLEEREQFLTLHGKKLDNREEIVTLQMRIFNIKVEALKRKKSLPSCPPLQQLHSESAEFLHAQLTELMRHSRSWKIDYWKAVSLMLTHCSHALDNPYDPNNSTNITAAAAVLKKTVDPELKIMGWALLFAAAVCLVAAISFFSAGLALPLMFGAIALIPGGIGLAKLVKARQFDSTASKCANGFFNLQNHSTEDKGYLPLEETDKLPDGGAKKA